MKSTKKEKLKKLGKVLVSGAKKTEKFVRTYGPRVHAHARAISESAMSALEVSPTRHSVDLAVRPMAPTKANLIPRRRKGYVDLTAKKKPKRVQGTRKGFYLDFT